MSNNIAGPQPDVPVSERDPETVRAFFTKYGKAFAFARIDTEKPRPFGERAISDFALECAAGHVIPNTDRDAYSPGDVIGEYVVAPDGTVTRVESADE